MGELIREQGRFESAQIEGLYGVFQELLAECEEGRTQSITRFYPKRFSHISETLSNCADIEYTMRGGG